MPAPMTMPTMSETAEASPSCGRAPRDLIVRGQTWIDRLGQMDRRSFLLGALAGVAGGALAGGFAAYGAGGEAALRKTDAVDRARPASGGPGGPGAPAAAAPANFNGYTSYAQQGEDLIIARVFEHLHIANPSFIDIGAHDPIVNNNTYLFYAHGSRGVLVEPNPYYAAKLRAARPLDKVIEAGIGTSEQAQADYYVIRGDGQLNTFSKEQADDIVKRDGPAALIKVVKMPLLDVNKVLAESFPHGGPDIFSVDTEGARLRHPEDARLRPFPPARHLRRDVADRGGRSEREDPRADANERLRHSRRYLREHRLRRPAAAGALSRGATDFPVHPACGMIGDSDHGCSAASRSPDPLRRRHRVRGDG